MVLLLYLCNGFLPSLRFCRQSSFFVATSCVDSREMSWCEETAFMDIMFVEVILSRCLTKPTILTQPRNRRETFHAYFYERPHGLFEARTVNKQIRASMKLHSDLIVRRLRNAADYKLFGRNTRLIRTVPWLFVNGFTTGSQNINYQLLISFCTHIQSIQKALRYVICVRMLTLTRISRFLLVLHLP